MSAGPDPDLALIDELSRRVLEESAGPLAYPDRELFLTQLALVEEHADVAATTAPGRGPRSLLKRIVLRLARVVTTKQTAYNRAVLATIQMLDTEIQAIRAEYDQRLGSFLAAATTSDAAIEALGAALDDSRTFLQAVADDLAAVRGLAGALQSHAETWTAALDRLAQAEQTATSAQAGVARERARVDLLLNEVRRPEDRGVVSAEVVSRLTLDRSSRLYAQHQDRFRGSSESLMDRFERGYTKEVEELAANGGPAADIGCGPGDWLSVLSRHGVAAWGVDLSPEAIEPARARGLDARVDDGIKALAEVEPGSLAAVTAFHVIEHLAFDELVALVEAALVALRPGGLLVLETPNAQNLAVAASTFYLDPSHMRPVPPDLADFVLTTVGFVDVTIRFLNAGLGPFLPDLGGESSAVVTALVKRINDTFFGPPDYAVIGRKLQS